MGFWSSTKSRLKQSTAPVNPERPPDNRDFNACSNNDTSKGLLHLKPGDSLCDGRYTIKGKLGAGRYSSVWLAHDARTGKHVAVKVLNSDFCNGQYDLFEIDIMKRVAEISVQSDHPGKQHVARMLDSFDHRSAAGQHTCIVMELLGTSIGEQTSRARRSRLSYNIARQIARQLLEALDFLHAECGVLHTDIQPSNILVELEDSEASVAEALGKKGSAQGVKLSSPSVFENNDVRIRLSDFGVACWVDRHLTDCIQPPLLRAPEIDLGAPWDPSVDIYNLGCVIFESVTGNLPFPGRPARNGAWTAEDDRLATLMDIFGSVPEIVLANASRSHEFFDSNRQLRRTPQSGTRSPLEELVRTPPSPSPSPSQSQSRSDDMPDADVTVFCDFLRGMLATDPRRRKTASEMLRHAWLRQRERESAVVQRPPVPTSPSGTHLCPPLG